MVRPGGSCIIGRMEIAAHAAGYADELVGRAQAAAVAFREYSQAQVDAIVHAVYEAAYEARSVHLSARMRTPESRP